MKLLITLLLQFGEAEENRTSFHSETVCANPENGIDDIADIDRWLNNLASDLLSFYGDEDRVAILSHSITPVPP